MTDNEIIKALECCNKDDCDNCPNDFGNCYANLAGYALDLINRQKAEIERLTNIVDDGAEVCHNCHSKYAEKIKHTKAEAVKELLEKFIKEYRHCDVDTEMNIGAIFCTIKWIVKEMIGENNGK